MYYYKARIYSPMLGRFLQTDPIGYKDQVNLYAYVGNDPVDGRDPTGLLDLYIGGAADDWFTWTVKRYADRVHGSYRSWTDPAGIMADITAAYRRGEPINIIGHSLGGSAAIIAAENSQARGMSIDLLITVDPVRAAGHFNRSNVTTWVNVLAIPSSSETDDKIAWTGRKIVGVSTTQEDVGVTSSAHHGDFEKMMADAHASWYITRSKLRHEERKRAHKPLIPFHCGISTKCSSGGGFDIWD
jgi:pimeloyl-ACP methyl ester carboxylesterase